MKKRIVCVCSLFVILLFSLLPSQAFAAGMDTRTLALINKPAVVMLYTESTADMPWHEFTVDNAINNAIQAELTPKIKDGSIDKDNFVSAYVQLYAKYLPK